MGGLISLRDIHKHISKNQLNEMVEADVQLVVPNKLHNRDPSGSEVELIGIDGMISNIREVHG
jgi:hypothetical protein